MESFLALTPTVGKPGSSVTKSEIPREAWRRRGGVSSSRKQGLCQHRENSPGSSSLGHAGVQVLNPTAAQGHIPGQYGLGGGQPENDVPPLLSVILHEQQEAQTVPLSGSGGYGDRTLARRVAREHVQARAPSSPIRCRR